MKKTLLLTLAILLSGFIFAQTAPNFTCIDCSGNSHDLYTECNNGDVIVIAWVMPCGSCISGALAGYNAVQASSAQVKFYLADDVGNTSCATMTSWANTTGMTACDAIFSNSAVTQTGYGTSGMPKVVVVGGSNHTIYYNQNSGFSQTAIQNAINTALNANGIKENNGVFSSLGVYPNPSNTSSELSMDLAKDAKVKVEILNSLAQKVADVFSGNLAAGQHTLKINTADLANGTYFVSCSEGNITKKIKLVVVH